MPVYDISGNEIVSDVEIPPTITAKRNDDNLVTEFLTTARSYLGKTDLEYKDGDTIFYKTTATNGIDCSTFVGLCLMGYAYEDSPYYTHQYKQFDAWEANTDWAVATMRYKISRYIDGHNPDERLRLACQFARWMQERSQSVPMTNGFQDVMPGDVVFWGHRLSSTGEWMHPDWYLHINHIGIILTREPAPDTYVVGGTTYTWDKVKYPFKHQIIEVTAVTPPCITSHWLEEGQEDPNKIYVNNVNTVVAICRPDLGALQAELT